MSYGIGARVEVVGSHYLGRWIGLLEQGEIVGRHISPAGWEVYDVRLDQDGKEYVFAPGDLEELRLAP